MDLFPYYWYEMGKKKKDTIDLNLLSLERLNPVSVISAVSKAAKEQGWCNKRIKLFQEEAALREDTDLYDMVLQIIS
jgi:hypothetical protein